jgi:hypothetical protein
MSASKELTIAHKVCDLIAEGQSMRSATKEAGIEITKFLRILNKEGDVSELAQHYVRARATRADARFERVDEIMAELRTGKLDAQQARVMLDAIKWQTGKENAKRYGDALDLTSKGEKLAETKVTIERVILHGKDQKGGA